MEIIQNKQPYLFTKDGTGRWYIEIEEWTGSRADLQMVAGADVMLDVVSKNGDEVTLLLSEEPFAGAYKLELIEVCPADIGGGMYRLEVYDGKIVNQKMWLCSVTEWVFKKLPTNIYFTIQEPTT